MQLDLRRWLDVDHIKICYVYQRKPQSAHNDEISHNHVCTIKLTRNRKIPHTSLNRLNKTH